MKLKEYIKEALKSIQNSGYTGIVSFDIGVRIDMEVDENCQNRIKFSCQKK